MAQEQRVTERFWDVQDISHRLHRVEGQVRGLEALVAKGARCEDVLTQLHAVQGALTAIGRIVEMCHTVERIEGSVGPLDHEGVMRALMTMTGGQGTKRSGSQE